MSEYLYQDFGKLKKPKQARGKARLKAMREKGTATAAQFAAAEAKAAAYQKEYLIKKAEYDAGKGSFVKYRADKEAAAKEAAAKDGMLVDILPEIPGVPPVLVLSGIVGVVGGGLLLLKALRQKPSKSKSKRKKKK